MKQKGFLEEQIKILEERIKEEEYGTEQYDSDMGRLYEMYEERSKLKEGFNWKPIEVGFQAVSAIAGLAMYAWSAKLAYVSDGEMKLCNNRIWNLKDKFLKK